MHKDFYASGFLYHPTTQQILLQQLNDSNHWLLFGGKNKNSFDPSKVFAQTIHKHLKIKLTLEAIRPIYDYLHDDSTYHYLVYASVSTIHKKIKTKKGITVAWFNFKQLHKVLLSEQTRQDITVGERVINALSRDTQATGYNKNFIIQ